MSTSLSNPRLGSGASHVSSRHRRGTAQVTDETFLTWFRSKYFVEVCTLLDMSCFILTDRESQ